MVNGNATNCRFTAAVAAKSDRATTVTSISLFSQSALPVFEKPLWMFWVGEPYTANPFITSLYKPEVATESVSSGFELKMKFLVGYPDAAVVEALSTMVVEAVETDLEPAVISLYAT